MAKSQSGAAEPAYDPSAFPPFANTADIVILTIADEELQVALIQRAVQPFKGDWALPGGFTKKNESLEKAAERELREETGIRAARLEQYHTYSEPNRDPRMRVVSTAFVAIVAWIGPVAAGSDAGHAEVVPVRYALGRRPRIRLAFDHRKILSDGVEYARRQLEMTSIATAFVGHEFTLTELRRVYEAAWGVQLDPGNFRRKVLATPGFVVETGRRAKPGPEGGKPPDLYRAGTETDLDPPLRRPAA